MVDNARRGYEVTPTPANPAEQIEISPLARWEDPFGDKLLAVGDAVVEITGDRG